MNDQQLLRYSRQIMLPEVDIAGQQRLLDAHAVIIGLGGLGAPVAMYLAAAGVGRLTLVDFDRVDLSNLQRQVIHDTGSLERPKVESAAARLARLNPEVRVETVARRLELAELTALAAQADVVLEASDNFASRYTTNAACVAAGTPQVSGAAIRFEGQVAVFDPRAPEGACYRCVFGEAEEPRESCSETGVLASLPGIIGSIQATEALKLLLDCGEPLANRLLLLDGWRMKWREMKLRRDPGCPVCGGREGV